MLHTLENSLRFVWSDTQGVFRLYMTSKLTHHSFLFYTPDNIVNKCFVYLYSYLRIYIYMYLKSILFNQNYLPIKHFKMTWKPQNKIINLIEIKNEMNIMHKYMYNKLNYFTSKTNVFSSFNGNGKFRF